MRPHQVQDTISINNVRNTINLITVPMIEIKKNIEDNIVVCKNHKKEIEEFQGTIEELADQLYIPVEELEQVQLDAPITVCGDNECLSFITVNNETRTNYKQKCHSPCYLEEDDNKIIGNKGLLKCRAFYRTKRTGEPGWFDKDTFLKDSKVHKKNYGGEVAWGYNVHKESSENCFECGHTYQAHLHIRYETKVVSKKLRDDSVHQKIITKEQVKDVKKLFVEILEGRIFEMNEEIQILKKAVIKFTHFLAENAITPYNDAYEEYIYYLIETRTGDRSQLQLYLEEHKEEKEAFKRILSDKTQNKKISEMSPESINSYFDELFKLKFSGPKIEQGLNLQRQSIAKEKPLGEFKHRVKRMNRQMKSWFKKIF